MGIAFASASYSKGICLQVYPIVTIGLYVKSTSGSNLTLYFYCNSTSAGMVHCCCIGRYINETGGRAIGIGIYLSILLRLHSQIMRL